jgi:phosphoglucomutase
MRCYPIGQDAKEKNMPLSPLAGKVPAESMLVNIPKLVSAYYTEIPDPSVSAERVAFGTSGHRGSSFDRSFNESHILAISQAICEFRKQQRIDGPLFLGMDTHALSQPALITAFEVLAANGVDVMLSQDDEYTPTPAISHAILCFNRGRKGGLADGIVITPSHNPPHEGGLKYNPPHGGPAEVSVTTWIENRANKILENQLKEVKKTPYLKALSAPTTHRLDYRLEYVNDLVNVIDIEAIRNSRITMGVDPLGGAGVHYWDLIANHYNLPLTVVNKSVDPTFRFMTLDWDGQIRMDPSSSYAMHRLINLKDRYDIAFACDTDHDRHGIVTSSSGLMPSNHFLSAAIYYLFQNRSMWNKDAGVGKTLVSSQMIDRIAKDLGKRLYEVPAGFKWFVDGLFNGSLGFVGEESAGASFLRLDGTVWTTDKDGIIPGLLAAEMRAKKGRDPGKLYEELTAKFGQPFYSRKDLPATKEQKEKIKQLSPEQISLTELAGEKVKAIINRAPGNDAPIGGVKICAENGWFAVRPSGTEDIYKIYAESFLNEKHLEEIFSEAESMLESLFR